MKIKKTICKKEESTARKFYPVLKKASSSKSKKSKK